MVTAALSLSALLAVPLQAEEALTEVTALQAEEALTEGMAPQAEEAVTEELLQEAETVEVRDVAENGVQEETEELYRLRFASDYQEVYDAFLKSRDKQYWSYGYVEDDLLDYAVEETASTMDMAASSSAPKTAGTGASAENGYSTTNLRQAGVDEADIIKTDGTYLYILQGQEKLVIVRADPEDLTIAGSIELPPSLEGTMTYAADMYVDNGTVCIVFNEQKRDRDDRKSQSAWKYYWMNETRAVTYDVSDPANIALLGDVWQEGEYLQSRKNGDVLYLYSRPFPVIDYYDPVFEDSILTIQVNGEELPVEKFCIPDCITREEYLLVSSVSLKEPDKIQDSMALLSGASQMYVSEQNLYVMNSDYSGSNERTEIVKLHYEDGKIGGVGACKVRGYVNNSFSIDEYQGNLRVLTTYTGSETAELMELLSDLFGFYYDDTKRFERHNALYIMDENLHRLSRLTGIAEGEEIRSARYFGDTVYFVTFRNTDPLFTADLSDPKAPRITGELKVSGFSSYLHPYGEGRLLGIGYEADEKTGWTTGLKLSMFDVSDPQQVSEIDRVVIPGITWCPAIENYKAILADADRNLIGFCYEDRYLLLGFTEGEGFEIRMIYDALSDMLRGASVGEELRGLYVGNDFYIAGTHFVTVFDMEDQFRKGDLLSLAQ